MYVPNLMVTLNTGERLVFRTADLLTPEAFRDSVFDQTGCRVRYSPAAHELVVSALVALADAPVAVH